MLFGKYFRREIFTYWFLVLLPLILVTELWLYFWGTHKLYGEILEIFCILLWPISFSISETLALIQMISCYILFFAVENYHQNKEPAFGMLHEVRRKQGGYYNQKR